ncbi:hypothetical protein CFP56_021667 [Quercus suber]|uniref:Uncharacterized protein n=1 Tax=Quercus suber TaxID=58331 RepID=A0AAW0KE47_QUESU
MIQHDGINGWVSPISISEQHSELFFIDSLIISGHSRFAMTPTAFQSYLKSLLTWHINDINMP